MAPDEPDLSDRFMICAPGGRDGEVIDQLLRSAGIACSQDEGDALLQAIVDGAAGGAVITDDALGRLGLHRLRDAIERQPRWSDFPFILLVRRGETREGSRSIEDLVNVTVLERPLHPATLISAVRSAVRGRARQRLAADYLAERERAEAQLRELADTLEQKVADRTQALGAANDRLLAEIAERERAEVRLVQAQKMEAIGQLTGGVAHDFNNLLTAVIGSLDLLLRRTDSEMVQRLGGNALQAAERGAKLTAQLLAFSRRQRLSPVPVDPNSIIGEMSDLLARSIGSHLSVETRLDPGLWRALADPTQLEVMILNLAINARDAMPEGGRLTISTTNVSGVPPQLASELKARDYVAVTIADTGTGMPPHVLERAFEPFFTTKKQGKGTGLGLAQLYGFARQSGGTARIESAVGEGTSVTIYLPRTDAEVEEGRTPILEAVSAANARILVVDDDEDVRTVAAAMVQELGFEVATASGGEAALALLGTEHFDLVLTDVAMPGMNGVELARRARAALPRLPLLFASGYADVETFGAELSAETVIKKPYRMPEIAARIGEALEDARGARAATADCA